MMSCRLECKHLSHQGSAYYHLLPVFEFPKFPPWQLPNLSTQFPPLPF